MTSATLWHILGNLEKEKSFHIKAAEAYKNNDAKKFYDGDTIYELMFKIDIEICNLLLAIQWPLLD